MVKNAVVLMVIVILIDGGCLLGQYSGGSGTESDPYQIATATDLINLGKTTTHYSKFFILTANIDLAGYTFTRAVIAPDINTNSGFTGTQFNGKFNGNGHIVSNLTINGTSRDYIGLIGYTTSAAVINNLSLISVNIFGHNLVGGLIGYNNYGTISNSYTSGTTNGYSSVGGLVGFNDYGTISVSYSTVKVFGNGLNIGGLVGSSYRGTISYSYFYLFGGPNNGYGTALDDSQIVDQQSFIGFDFAGNSSDGTNDYWTIEAGHMPRLTWQEAPGLEPPLHHIATTLSGTGYADDPFIIASIEDILEFRNNSTLRIGYYRMENDIDLTGTTYTEAFIPETFNGIFNGNGHSISNLTIAANLDNIGLFSTLYGSINNLALINNDIGGGSFVGGMVGYSNYSIISNSYTTGTVNGSNYVGGLAGDAYKISNCYTTGTVNGSYYVGGLIGNVGVISNCHTIGAAIGISYVGGLAGYGGVISSSYTTGPVNGWTHVGGLAGDGGVISSSYATGSVYGNNLVGGLVGGSDYGYNEISNSYATGNVTGSGDYIGGLIGNNYRSTISSSYAAGMVTGSNNVGGLTFGGTTSASYFYLFGGPNNGYGTALDDSQIVDQQSFIGFDFAGNGSDGTNDYWTIEAGHMPRLTWQEAPGLEPPLHHIATTLSGTGYADDPFIIASIEDILEFRNNSTLRIGYYRMENDIDLTGTTYTEAFIPETFNGIFNGNGHSISNLTIAANLDNIGLFSTLYGSINNLALINNDIGGGSFVGGMVGKNYYGTINTSYSIGAVNGYDNVGGLVGWNSGTISYSYTTEEVNGYDNVGGLVGWNSGTISYSYATEKVNGYDNVGGLVGWNSGTISYSYANGAVTGTEVVGGLIGINSGTINCSYATGLVYGDIRLGGLVGINSGKISSSYANGAVAGTEYIGGLVGWNVVYNNSSGTINCSYATGEVTGSGNNVGGLVGYKYAGTISNCFWDTETSGWLISDGGTGKSTAEMQDVNTFLNAGWDFDNTWHMPYQATGYPMLWWQRDIPGDTTGSYGVDMEDYAAVSAEWLDALGMDDLMEVVAYWLEN